MLPISRAFLRLQMRTRDLHDPNYQLYSNGALLHPPATRARALIRLLGHTGILIVVAGKQPCDLFDQIRNSVAEVERDCSQNFQRFSLCPCCVQHGGGGESDAPALAKKGRCISCRHASDAIRESCPSCNAVGCALYPLIADERGICTRCNTAFSAHQLRDGAKAVPALQRRSRIWDFVCGDAFRSAPGWSDQRAIPSLLSDHTDDRLDGFRYRLTTLRADETDAARRREFSRVRELFDRFVGVENEQRFQLTAVEVIDNPKVEQRFSEHCAKIRERLMRAGGDMGDGQIGDDAAAVARLASCDEETQALRDELRQHIQSLPWAERCTLLMQDRGVEFNDLVVSYPFSHGQRVRDELHFAVLEERQRWREWIMNHFER